MTFSAILLLAISSMNQPCQYRVRCLGFAPGFFARVVSRACIFPFDLRSAMPRDRFVYLLMRSRMREHSLRSKLSLGSPQDPLITLSRLSRSAIIRPVDLRDYDRETGWWRDLRHRFFPKSLRATVLDFLPTASREISLARRSLSPFPARYQTAWRCSMLRLSYQYWSGFVVIGRCVTYRSDELNRIESNWIESDRIESDRIGSDRTQINTSCSSWLSRAGRTELDICRWLALISPLTLIRPLFRRRDRQSACSTRWGPWLADLCGKKGPRTDLSLTRIIRGNAPVWVNSSTPSFGLVAQRELRKFRDDCAIDIVIGKKLIKQKTNNRVH